jgi:UV DNA damage endonuclease
MDKLFVTSLPISQEQAVFELMRTFRLPGWDTFNNLIPYERADDNKPEPRKAKKKKTKKQLKAEEEDPSLIEPEEPEKPVVPDEEVGMGGPLNRVYWPPGMEEWLRPKKREVKKKNADEMDAAEEDEILANPTPMNLKQRQEIKARRKAMEETEVGGEGDVKLETLIKNGKTPPKRPTVVKRIPKRKAVDTPSPSEGEIGNVEEEEDAEVEEDEDDSMSDLSDGMNEDTPPTSVRPAGRCSARKAKTRVSYAESEGDAMGDSP